MLCTLLGGTNGWVQNLKTMKLATNKSLKEKIVKNPPKTSIHLPFLNESYLQSKSKLAKTLHKKHKFPHMFLVNPVNLRLKKAKPFC